MSRGDWTFFDLITGRILGTFSGPEDALPHNTPDGCGALEGLHDGERLHVDVSLRKVVALRPEKPSEDHEWDEAGHRWMPPIAARRAVADDRAAREAIDAVELRALRAMREGLLRLLPADAPERRLLAQADSDIAAQRSKIKRG